MRGDGPLRPGCRAGADHVAERLIRANTPKPAGFPLAQGVLGTSFERMAKHNPWFPHRPGHDAHVIKFRMRVLRPISTSHCHRKADDRTSKFQSSLGHGARDDMRKQRIARDQDVGARYGDPKQEMGETAEKCMEAAAVFRAHDRESWEWRAFMAIERRWYAPDAAFARTELILFFGRIFHQAIWWVGYYRMDGR